MNGSSNIVKLEATYEPLACRIMAGYEHIWSEINDWTDVDSTKDWIFQFDIMVICGLFHETFSVFILSKVFHSQVAHPIHIKYLM